MTSSPSPLSSSPDLMYSLLQARIHRHNHYDLSGNEPMSNHHRGVSGPAGLAEFDPRFTHFQAQPQPLPYSGYGQPYPPAKDPSLAFSPGSRQAQQHSAFVPFNAHPYPPSSAYSVPNQPPSAAQMGVGSHAGDFELFGQHQQAPMQGQQQPQVFFQPQPLPLTLADYRSSFGAPHTAPLPSYAPSSYPIPIPSSASSSSSHADNDYPSLPDLVADEGASPASFSPPSPRFVPPVRPPLFRGGQGSSGEGTYRGERAASVPIPDAPRPMRRKTQESRDWPSFYSSGSSSTSSSMSSSAYLPTPQLNGQGLLPSAARGYVDEPASFVTPTATSHSNPFDAANLVLSPAPQYPYYQQQPAPPHTDHPLLASEQSDLLRRVQRDLVDVDLSSIKGPLRALALSGGDRESTPMTNSGYPLHHDANGRTSAPPVNLVQRRELQQLAPSACATEIGTAPVLRSPATASAAAEDALSAGTVSPQEAFLDYDEVDSRLNDPADPLYSVGRDRDFGVGVGGSLFAPLPMATAARGTAASPVIPFAPSPLRARSTTPTATSCRAPPSPKALSSISQPPSHHAQGHGHGHAGRRGPHPFSVPQNAVTWAARRSRSGSHIVGGVVDGDADDDDGDFGSQDPDDEDADEQGHEREEVEARKLDAVRQKAGLGAGFGAFEKRDIDLKPALRLSEGQPPLQPIAPKPTPSEEERVRYGLDDAGKPIFGTAPLVKDEEKPSLAAYAPPPPAASGVLAASAPAAQFAPPAPPPPSGVTAFHTELQKQKAQLAHSGSAPILGSGTSTPRRAAAASALAGLNAYPEQYATGSDTGSAAPSPPVRPSRQRKRSRAYRAMYGEYSDEEGADIGAAVDDDANAESDASYHSSASSFGGTAATGAARQGGGGPTPKRRRRAPATGDAGARSAEGGIAGGNASGTIRCDHVNSDGTTCGVVFRRPYDLARHRETIHNESLGGEKLKAVKEWRCHECDGTFSRKDALIRHCRIRGHKAG